jgi:hypothetical protein
MEGLVWRTPKLTPKPKEHYKRLMGQRLPILDRLTPTANVCEMKILPPGYCYTDNYVTRYNRQNFMKHKLVNKYDLDPADVSDKSEWEIVRDLGFDRLWDCGKKRWRFDV